jgi:hypothetical protein
VTPGSPRLAAPKKALPPKGFLPDAWFKDQTKAWTAAVKTPLDKDVGLWPWQFHEHVVLFFDKFQKNFEAAVNSTDANRAVNDRVEMRKGRIEMLATIHEKFFRQIDRFADLDDPESYLEWAARNAIKEKLVGSLKNVGDLLKATFSVDDGAVKALVQKVLKAATPEERASITNDARYDVKYRFLARIKFEAAAQKLLKKDPVNPTLDIPSWIEFLAEILRSTYAEGGKNLTLREFDIHGMKVVVDDASLGGYDIDKYVKYLDEAYQRMKAKGVAKAWYGTVFIQCEGCGGVNYNTGGGVGGHYTIQKDTVTIFSRPGKFIVELMAHELGHRYWFKQMSSTQRARFEALVKVKPGRKPEPDRSPPQLLSEEKVAEAKKQIRGLGDKVRAALKDFKASRLPSAKKALDKFQPVFDEVASTYRHDFLDAVHSAGANSQIDAEVRGLFQDVLDSYPKVPQMLRAAGDEIPRRINAYPDDGKWTYETMYKDARANRCGRRPRNESHGASPIVSPPSVSRYASSRRHHERTRPPHPEARPPRFRLACRSRLAGVC